MNSLTETNIRHKLKKDWINLLQNEFEADYFNELMSFIGSERSQGKVIYPPEHLIFNAFEKTSVDDLKVVILGQDPYHGPHQAHGLCFSVNNNVKLPPSLKNIFKELQSDLGVAATGSGNLEQWAKQGVLLLNSILTVREGEPGSHQNRGWEQFTDAVIRLLSMEKEGLIFLLWGRYAQAKEILIDTQKHFILKAAHPSPFSAYQGFYGCRHFSKTNEILRNTGREPIDWSLTPG